MKARSDVTPTPVKLLTCHAAKLGIVRGWNPSVRTVWAGLLSACCYLTFRPYRMEFMVRFLELAWDALRNTALQLAAWFRLTAAAGQFDPRGWPMTVWLAVALAALVVLAVALIRRARNRTTKSVPEMMISHGEITTLQESHLDDDVTYGVGAPARGSHRLALTLSNLNSWPVQLLELAVRTRGLRQPVVAEAGAVVPPNGAVDVVAELFDLPGDVGVVELFLYSNRGAKRTYRLTAPLEWEPWDSRYRIKSLSARMTRVTALASQERRQFEKRSYRAAKRRERRKEFFDATWQRAGQLTSQLKQRRSNNHDRVSAPERRRAAFAGGHTPTAPYDQFAKRNDSAGTAEEPKPLPGRQRLDFPDEF